MVSILRLWRGLRRRFATFNKKLRTSLNPNINDKRLGKVLTVYSSNSGRSIGDVFLALFSSSLIKLKKEPIVFLTHTNHSEVASLFHDSINLILLSDRPDSYSATLNPIDIHSYQPAWRSQLPSISNPWRYFILNGVKPFALSFDIPPVQARITGRSIILFPERSDNERLTTNTLVSFISFAKAKGYTVYTNCFINSNYEQNYALPETIPLTQVSLTEMIAIAQNPGVIMLGTRCGLFDILYFTSKGDGAKLVILYPDKPDWLWDARFYHDKVRTEYGEFFYDRRGVFEFREADFSMDVFASVLTSP